MKKAITQYYNDLARDYDIDRFNNTYGRYIHAQEDAILQKYVLSESVASNLDLACGTGRFLDYADSGADISQEMVKVAQEKYPDKKIYVEDAEALSFKTSSFDNVLSFHLLMHLDPGYVERIFDEVHRVLKPGGHFIFDIPSNKRRKLTGYKSEGWHGANQLSVQSIVELIGSKWELVTYHGIAFFPIHRIPLQLRKKLLGLDNWLCNSSMREYSSYLIFILKKR